MPPALPPGPAASAMLSRISSRFSDWIHTIPVLRSMFDVSVILPNSDRAFIDLNEVTKIAAGVVEGEGRPRRSSSDKEEGPAHEGYSGRPVEVQADDC
jgi:hypothetical protein